MAEHGTSTKYRDDKCRCEPCREAKRREKARYAKTPLGRAERRRSNKAAQQKHRDRCERILIGGCIDCEAMTHLHFHHLDPSTKLFEVSQMGGYSDALFRAEVAKCVVVCDECHTDRHLSGTF